MASKVNYCFNMSIKASVLCVTVNGFENSKSLFLSVHLIGETPEQQTRLFERNILTKGDYPLDLKVTLKVKR